MINNAHDTFTLITDSCHVGGTASSSLNIKPVCRPPGQAVRVQHFPHTEAHPHEENVTASLDIAHNTTTTDVSEENSSIFPDKSLKASAKPISSLELSTHHFPHTREFIEQHSSQHNEDTSDDDFYDAEEANSEFSITLPDLSPNESKNNGNKASRKTCGNLASNKSNDNQTGLNNSQDEDSIIPAGSDIADEYESDVGFTDDEADEYTDQNSQSNQFGKLREARVIQPRSRRCGRFVRLCISQYHQNTNDMQMLTIGGLSVDTSKIYPQFTSPFEDLFNDGLINVKEFGTFFRAGTLVSSGDCRMTQDIPTTGESNGRGHYQADSEPDVIKKRLPIVRRLSIPPKPNISLNLWSIMKNCIGKELTKIPMPVSVYLFISLHYFLCCPVSPTCYMA
ncbi:unnamed protein product [Schistosoma mattheei]|uniref:Uncharacterized protein n=1 Tax=Schistosoma mattheei TaxID=31246 RepID=A0A183NE17_9TREM|nr:unnamed protein product [Schistosoma mattheei]